MPLPHLIIPAATRLTVNVTGGAVPHPTSGYRDWKGHFASSEPIVALAVAITNNHVCWARSGHRAPDSLETRILFSPMDEHGLHIRVSFSISDATAYCDTSVDSIQVQPAPILRPFETGSLTRIVSVTESPFCELMALFLARRDVVSVRNGIWHASGNVVSSLSEPWRTILTYGRSGELDAAEHLYGL
jgi:hypothetical protein